jgi:hypothetical protein
VAGSDQGPLPLDRVLRALPQLPELGVLRDALLAASEPDPAHAWSSASRYVTFDKRVVPPVAVQDALARARAAAHARVDGLYGGVSALVAALSQQDTDGSVARLLELAEWLDARGGEWVAAL